MEKHHLRRGVYHALKEDDSLYRRPIIFTGRQVLDSLQAIEYFDTKIARFHHRKICYKYSWEWNIKRHFRPNETQSLGNDPEFVI